MPTQHDHEFRAGRDAAIRQIASGIEAYHSFTDEHEQDVIDTTAFQQAGPRGKGKSAVLKLTLRCYPDGKVELDPDLHTHAAPANKSEMYGAAQAVPSIAAAIALLCERGIAEAKTYTQGY